MSPPLFFAPSFSVLLGAGYQFTSTTTELGDIEDEETSSDIPLILEGIIPVGEKGKVVIGPSYSFNTEDSHENGLTISATYIFLL